MKMLNWALAHEVVVIPFSNSRFLVPRNQKEKARDALDRACRLAASEVSASEISEAVSHSGSSLNRAG